MQLANQNFLAEHLAENINQTQIATTIIAPRRKTATCANEKTQ